MTSPPRTFVVVNPHSANGATGRRWPRILARLRKTIGAFEVSMTAGVGHASRLVATALVDGYERILSLGGDGTHNEVVNGFFDGNRPINPAASLMMIPSGTGGDLRRSLGIDRSVDGWLPVLLKGKTRSIDVGSVAFRLPWGEEAHRLFVNITSFGIGGLVDRKVNESSKALGGRVSFLIGTLKALATYENRFVRLTGTGPDGHTVFDERIRINNVAVANGQYFGGGMWVAPQAVLDDGFFDVVILGDLSKFDVIFKAHRIFKGTHLSLPQVRSFRASHVEAIAEEGEVLIDMDGEQPGRLPISLDILPRALRVIAPSTA